MLIACKTTKSISKADKEMLYFGQDVPTMTPALFAPGIISKPDRHEFGCTLSRDGKEFYFGVDNNGKMEIHRTLLENGRWSEQENIFQGDSCSYNDPMFSLDENRIYFISNRPLVKGGKLKDVDIWYMERTDKGWSEPQNAGNKINNHLDQYYSSFSKDGSLYFASQDTVADAPNYAFDIYKSKFKSGVFQQPKKLSETINTNRYEADVFIDPDERYMIFCSIRRQGLGIGDLYISFKGKDGNWLPAVNMGSTINTDKHELCPYVTSDGKFLFYTSNQDIYWVSTEILEQFKL